MSCVIKKVLSSAGSLYTKLCLFLSLIAINITAWADIPAAPNVSGGTTTDYIKTGQGVAQEVLSIGITILYVGSILAYCSGILWLLMQAKKTKEWGNFFKGTGIGLGVLVLILILLNQAKTALGLG